MLKTLFLMKTRKLQEALPVFTEMIKNECVPSHSNCSSAVKLYVDHGDPYMALKVWKCMIKNYNSDLEETGNFLVLGLRENNRVAEAVNGKLIRDVCGLTYICKWRIA
ncbi:hypothetical protein F0562_004164 [Nyssa sinensis]|uniref:Pentacotripeptide-repeat region of PRORP domain-containing protein n=1 Tax=Nyssa sinensis TaxID=561372 RepID=A0A5J5BXE0_9ASTE|nr:hypothetical protein F0562_004164 [Nyssa sinensis]